MHIKANKKTGEDSKALEPHRNLSHLGSKVLVVVECQVRKSILKQKFTLVQTISPFIRTWSSGKVSHYNFQRDESEAMKIDFLQHKMAKTKEAHKKKIAMREAKKSGKT